MNLSTLLLRRRMMMLSFSAPIPATNQIVYQSRDGNLLNMASICNANLINNEIVGEYMIATFDGDVISINNWQSRNIKYVDFPTTCTTFARTAFDNSNYLKRMIFRASNYTFGNYCFSVFASSSVVTLYATTPPIRNAWAIGSNPLSVKPTIEVPVGCAEAYRNSSYWAGYTIVEMS